MIHIVTHRNRRAYALQLRQLTAILGREQREGSALALVKSKARPSLDDDDGAYLLMVDDLGDVRFGVSLRSSAGRNTVHRLVPAIASADAPASDIWECLFFTDRRRAAGTRLSMLAAFWTVAIRTAVERGAARLVGIDLDGRQSGARRMFDVHCGDRDEDLEQSCAADAPLVVSLDAKTAATLTATEVERLLGQLSRVGPSSYATVCEILDLAARLAKAHGARDAIERIERVDAPARLAT